MTADTLAARYALGLDIIRDAGALALGYFRKRDTLTIRSKGLQDMVSEADLNTEILIRDRISQHFPGDAFLGEETGLSDYSPEQGIWVVDPIDGTQPFVSGLSSWCVSIAFVQNGLLKFGMVYAPERDELFAGGVEFPATLNGKPVGQHPGRALNEGMVGMGFSTRIERQPFYQMFEAVIDAGGMFYRDGSGALTLCYVADGRLLGYIEQHINSWDCLGAMAVIEAAGLKTNDFLANDGLRKGNALAAGNAAVHAEMMAILERFPVKR